MAYASKQHKRIVGIACGGTGTSMCGVVGTHTDDIKRGWFIMNNTTHTRGGGFGG